MTILIEGVVYAIISVLPILIAAAGPNYVPYGFQNAKQASPAASHARLK